MSVVLTPPPETYVRGVDTLSTRRFPQTRQSLVLELSHYRVVVESGHQRRTPVVQQHHEGS